MMVQNAQNEQSTWRKSWIFSSMGFTPPFQSHLLHTPINEKRDAILGRRTSATLQDNSRWDYIYNQRSEITSAIRKNASNVTQNTMRYQYDTIGNRTSSYEDASSKTYDANCLNQYTEIDVTGGSSVCPQYDDDGNMTRFDDWTYSWDAENRLVKAVNGNTRLEYIYDALSRRVAKKIYQYNSLSLHERYVYDGMKLLATYNAKSSFAQINTFLWQPFGLDVPLVMTCNNTVYGYFVDANKNVLGLFNPSGTRVATYLYDPSGQIISSSGTIAADNPLQFSSEQFDADLCLVYYNFRYYFPAIGKWLTKDPIGEEGGWNLYTFCRNDAVNGWDANGGEIKSAIEFFRERFEFVINFKESWYKTTTPFKNALNYLNGKTKKPPFERYPQCIDHENYEKIKEILNCNLTKEEEIEFMCIINSAINTFDEMGEWNEDFECAEQATKLAGVIKNNAPNGIPKYFFPRVQKRYYLTDIKYINKYCVHHLVRIEPQGKCDTFYIDVFKGPVINPQLTKAKQRYYWGVRNILMTNPFFYDDKINFFTEEQIKKMYPHLSEEY